MTRTRLVSRELSTLLALLALAAAPALAAQEPSSQETSERAESAGGEELISAAQRGDLEAVRALLDRGVDVNSESRYGATPLAFAVNRGNEELARLLLERGADVDAKDTFYGFTPVVMAMMGGRDSEPHRRILLEILKRKPADADQALLYGVQQADLEVIRAAVDAGVTARGLRSALTQAETRGLPRVIELMRELAPPEDESPGIELSPEQLALYEGDYRNEQLGMSIKIFLEGEALKLQVQGQPAFTLGAVAEHEFETVDLPDVAVAFAGRAGTIERFALTQAGRTLTFGRVDGSAMTLTSEAPEGSAEPAGDVVVPSAERSQPLPWPSFRGRNAAGIADGQGAPTTWNAESGDGVLWKERIPGIALASPVIWGERVFLASAVSREADRTFRTGLYGDVDSVEDDSLHRWIVQARDLRTGELIWQRTASEGRPKVKRHMKSSHANPTPVTDGERVVVSFGSEGLFCYDWDGQLLWRRDLGVLSSGWFYDHTFEWGFSSSPILYQGRVIVQGGRVAGWRGGKVRPPEIVPPAGSRPQSR